MYYLLTNHNILCLMWYGKKKSRITKKDERRTSNIERPTSNNDVAFSRRSHRLLWRSLPAPQIILKSNEKTNTQWETKVQGSKVQWFRSKLETHNQQKPDLRHPTSDLFGLLIVDCWLLESLRSIFSIDNHKSTIINPCSDLRPLIPYSSGSE